MTKRIISIIIIILTAWEVGQSQVLISLLLGDKLNSGKLKFGLDGGVNFSNITNINPSKFHTGINLGFYFDILLKENKNWWLHTGVIVKSPMGADKLDVYSLDNKDLDSLYSDGYVNRKLRYFNIPILIRYKFKSQVFIELGPMLGLLSKANDVFYASINAKDDETHTRNIREESNRLDVGVVGGIGYHLKKGEGINFGVRYYQGLRNLPKEVPDKPQYNSNIYLFVSIPIGAGPKAKEKNAEAAKKKAARKAEKKRQKEMKEREKKKDNDIETEN